MFTILQAETSEQIECVRQIFREYESWLGLDLCFQNFEEELRTLPGKYAPPDGALYLAYSNGDLAGCIAMRKLEDGICEMKRLYVRENFRNLGLGRLLVEKLLAEARSKRYKKMRLDTCLPKMTKAARLDESYGFRSIPPYYDNPHDGVLFMELEF